MLRRFLIAVLLACGLILPAVAPDRAAAQIFMSPEDAKKLGAQEHPKILKEFGGPYDDPAIGAYVAGIAGRIAGQSGQPASSFTFTVLNSPVVNAFALPGGYVYITRGTLAIANNEAEAAGVLGHEIGHVIAHHSEKRYDKSVFTNLGVAGASILGSIFLGSGAGDLIGQVGQIGGGAYLAAFSRENELEADTIGVKLLSRVGYAPDAQAAFLQSLSDYSDLATKMAGQAGRDRMNDLFATHPGGPQRVREAMAAANEFPASPVYRRDEYLDRINGMLYGDDPKEGVVRGTTFMHPDLRLSFSVPDGWRISNTSDAVIASGSGGKLQFDIEGDKRKLQSSRNALDYLTRLWVPNLRLSNAEAITVGGMPAATGSARVQMKSGGSADVRFVAVGFPTDAILRFVIIAPAGGLSKIEPAMIRSVNTLKYLSEAEAKAIKPLRLKVVTVQPGDTAEKFAEQLPFGRFKLEQFRVLNGLREGETLKPGERVKLVE
ncbi:M48 family metalloprotease [Ferrovibrio sp.]|jgi:predicted Zn-dependent protease|uniref:M48 family metalloprotease n=1 Tax=Ferrovibrio sp. TaxID=1917215 RepID=UPI0035ADEF80